MSRNVLEKVLWQLSVERAAKERFREDGRKFLGRFPLSEEEVEMVLAFDVGALQRLGVNPMLTMGFWQELAPNRSMRLYKERLGATEEQNAAFSAALKS
ncbi:MULTISPECIES: extradiol ring-cleavage dioxygenase [Pseudomonas]|jgi:protocatechuate 4,5-dioxygenase alpha chain|uniref:extradiol ring-cleavage dioxygenase n=1 Tax=Pseudomonas TaxID=286 RepID=UPI000C2A5927|nr:MULTISPECIES: extradiol ring-cleavage dioxygenase [Pseudomonas]MBA4246593.1 extradiol ring-cleavage dioxygenase [Pseudomonas sp.]MBF8160877.1 extradiol ring-cleavage dioxygenase [Pseudomonas mendocina]PJX08524.1 extradiol ring-cleavage dioxygenase [Pseudomonas putida]HEP8939963.1 extradiol ring-cleavage dioxygenase [Pseudomonas aeruginosa]